MGVVVRIQAVGDAADNDGAIGFRLLIGIGKRASEIERAEFRAGIARDVEIVALA